MAILFSLKVKTRRLGLRQMEKIEQEIAKVGSDIETVTAQIETIEFILEKEFEDWSRKEKNKYGNHEQLRGEKNKLREKESKLRDEKNKLNDILLEKERQKTQGMFVVLTLGQGSPTSLNSDQALEKFSELAGVQISAEEETILIQYFPDYVRLLKRGRLNEKGAKDLLRLIWTTLKTATIIAVKKNHGYVFGRSIGVGGGKTILQKVFSLETGEMYCAKVFLNVAGSSGIESAQHDIGVSSILQPHVHIAPIVNSIEFCHENGAKHPLLAVMMPLYHISLAELLRSLHEMAVPQNVFNHITLGLLSAAGRFQDKGLCHCDIKPENIMMDGFNPVLVDFGAVVSIGEAIREWTPVYSLDADHNAVTPEYDLFCIVTTLVRCFCPSFELQNRTKTQMISLINEVCRSNTILDQYGTVCLLLLDCKSSNEGFRRFQSYLNLQS